MSDLRATSPSDSSLSDDNLSTPIPQRPKVTSDFQPRERFVAEKPAGPAAKLPTEASKAKIAATPAKGSDPPQGKFEFQTRAPAKRREVSPLSKREWRIVEWMSPWFVSFLFHSILTFILAFLFIPHAVRHVLQIDVTVADNVGFQLQDANLDSPSFESIADEPALSESPLDPVDDPIAMPLLFANNIGEAASSAPVTEEAPAVVGFALSGRSEGNKKALLAQYGGNEDTEAAVELGLKWLQRNQKPDGTWSLRGPFSKGSTFFDQPVSATAMACLAFQGAGHTTSEGQYKKELDRAWKALLAMQDKDGFFDPNLYRGRSARDGFGGNQFLYSHAQATIALCELYAMTNDSRYYEPATRAVRFCIYAQSEEGGWRYQPKVDSDMSVTGWFVMALQSARMAGLHVPESTFDKARDFIDSVGDQAQSRYSYMDNVGRRGEFSFAMTAEALLCRQYDGWKGNDKRLLAGADLLLERKINYNDKLDPDVYYWYYATQVMHHLGSRHWQEWNRALSKEVPARQVKEGREAGSWDPSADEWGRQAGRLYTTCLSLYMLEVYYRHMPLYQHQLEDFQKAK